jgi:N-acetylglutamate synthase-like GNAT family acetyltransferase
MIHVERALMKDLGHATNIEIKSQEFPLLLDVAKAYIEDSDKEICLARIGNRRVGVAFVRMDKIDKCLVIGHLAVLPEFRHNNVSNQLMKYLCKLAWLEEIPKLRIYVPSYKIDDLEDPWNIRDWLYKQGFKATGVTHNDCKRYGKEYDTYQFERVL